LSVGISVGVLLIVLYNERKYSLLSVAAQNGSNSDRHFDEFSVGILTSKLSNSLLQIQVIIPPTYLCIV
jgi:hypothetical protein